MKRRLLLGITVLALAVCSLPALAAPADPAADALAAIFAPAPDLGTSSPAQNATLLPRILLRSECNATAACPSPFNSVSCVGEADCFSVSKCYASCDGFPIWCPNPSPSCFE